MELDVVRSKVEGRPAELEHADLEGHARSCGWFLEDHRQGLAAKRLTVRPWIPLHLVGQGEDLLDVLAGIVLQRDQVLLLHPVTLLRASVRSGRPISCSS